MWEFTIPNENTELRKRAVRIADAINSIDGITVSEIAKQLSEEWATEELVWSKYDTYLYDDCKVLKNLLNIQNEADLNLADKYKFKNYKPVLHEYLED